MKRILFLLLFPVLLAAQTAEFRPSSTDSSIRWKYAKNGGLGTLSLQNMHDKAVRVRWVACGRLKSDVINPNPCYKGLTLAMQPGFSGPVNTEIVADTIDTVSTTIAETK
jgi:hypothetical protein